jgi:phage/plasmid-like protein (TIGR03299 family)
MAHEILENDTMFSVRVKPWHGLGTILDDVPSIDEAIQQSGLDWKVEVWPSYISDRNGSLIEVPDTKAVVRTDKTIVLGNVGNRYEVYQNSDMWNFIDDFQKSTDCKLETAGSLRNGKKTWVLAKNSEVEYLSGDPVEEYFLFNNSFDGSSPIQVMFTNIRVVCNNTLQMAIKGANNVFKVRHTLQCQNTLNEVKKALGLRDKYQLKMMDSMRAMVKTQMNQAQIDNFLGNVIFPMPRQIVQEVDAVGKVISLQEASKKAITMRTNKIATLNDLIEGGAGANIQGVKGSVYGVFQALVEFADHEKQMKVGDKNLNEVRFESIFWGSGAAFKDTCFDECMKLAA